MFKKLLLICSLSTGLYNMPAIAASTAITRHEIMQLDKMFNEVWDMIMNKVDMVKIKKKFINLTLRGTNPSFKVYLDKTMMSEEEEDKIRMMMKESNMIYMGQGKKMIGNMMPNNVMIQNIDSQRVIIGEFRGFIIIIAMEEMITER